MVLSEGRSLAEMDRARLEALVREQEVALATYKETLARIYQEFDAKIEELSLIRRVSDVLRQAEDLQGLALGLVEVVISELPADHVCLMLADAELTQLVGVAQMSRAEEEPRPCEGGEVPLGRGLLGAAVAGGRVLLRPVLGEGELEPWPEPLPRGARSLLALPLIARQQLLGAMILTAEGEGTFAEEHTRTLTIICDHAASALVNVRLIEQLGEINERLLASELEAHQAREYLQRVLDTASDLILIADRQGRITYANHAAAEAGLDREDLLGRSLAGLFTNPQRAARLLESQRHQEEELEMAVPEGSPRLMLVSCTPLPETGEVLAILRDITTRRALERQLMHAEKLASVGILAAGVAHEIGNPLSAISGYAQLLAKDRVAEADRREFARAISELSQRIDRIIRELLDYSRPSALAGQLVEVNQAVEAVLNMFFTRKRLQRQGLSIHRDLARGLPPVRLERDQLQQVVLNMAMNAAQAMGEGGVLTIRTRGVRDREGDWVVIEVQDTGPGIPPEHLARIFEPFFTTKPPGQGTGLGLSICDRIVSQAGGRITVESRPGQGTVFAVWLPADAGGGEAASSPARPEEAP